MPQPGSSHGRVLTYLRAGAAALLLFHLSVFDLGLVPLTVDGEGRRFIVRSGESFRQIAQRLQEEGLVRSYRQFALLAWLQDSAGKLKAGEYDLKREKTPLAILNKMVRGDVVTYRVTIPEGLGLFDIAAVLQRDGLAVSGSFLNRAADPILLGELGIEGQSVEGYLFPDTYFLTRGLGEETIIRTMVARFRKAFSDGLKARAASMGMTVHQVVTLASLIELEAAEEREKPLVSAVFHNRLKRGMKLQSDPTAVYGLPGFSGRISRRHLELPTPYNTYLVDGLPPGPIGSPGATALRAALYPAPVNYLYFVSMNDGTHKFTTNLSDHLRAVAQFRIGSRTP